MRTSSKLPRRMRGPVRLPFRVNPGDSVNYPTGRRGYLISRDGVRIPYIVVVCSRTGNGVMDLNEPQAE